MNWNPVASADDFAERKSPDYLVYALEQRYNFDKQAIAPDIAPKLLSCKKRIC
jgi:NAD(P)H dehydrogenase (quinone)